MINPPTPQKHAISRGAATCLGILLSAIMCGCYTASRYATADLVLAAYHIEQVQNPNATADEGLDWTEWQNFLVFTNAMIELSLCRVARWRSTATWECQSSRILFRSRQPLRMTTENPVTSQELLPFRPERFQGRHCAQGRRLDSLLWRVGQNAFIPLVKHCQYRPRRSPQIDNFGITVQHQALFPQDLLGPHTNVTQYQTPAID
jgi:hypothetical protein